MDFGKFMGDGFGKEELKHPEYKMFAAVVLKALKQFLDERFNRFS